MFKKLAILGIAAVLLGGCTARDIFKTNNAAEDQKPGEIASPTPIATSSSDPGIQMMPSTSSSSEIDSLDTDINNTKILDEDLSDLN